MSSIRNTQLQDMVRQFFDVENLEALCCGDRQLMQQIIEEFLQNTTVYRARIQLSLLEQNAIDLIRHAANLRGTSSVCQVQRLPGMCRALEICAEKGNFQAAKRIFRTLEVHLNQLEQHKYDFAVALLPLVA